MRWTNLQQRLRKWRAGGALAPPGFLRVSTFFEFCPLLKLEIEVQNYKPTDGMLSGPPGIFPYAGAALYTPTTIYRYALKPPLCLIMG